MARAADSRRRPGDLPAVHRHQRGDLLLRQDLRGGRFSTPHQQTAATTWSLGVVNVLATLIAVAYVDRLGRRPLMFAGLIGMGLSLLVMSFCFRYISHLSATTTGATANTPSDAGVIMLVAMVAFPEPGGPDRRIGRLLPVHGHVPGHLHLRLEAATGDQGQDPRTDPADVDSQGGGRIHNHHDLAPRNHAVTALVTMSAWVTACRPNHARQPAPSVRRSLDVVCPDNFSRAGSCPLRSQ
nr:MFS transporter [Catellatospora tritici]